MNSENNVIHSIAPWSIDWLIADQLFASKLAKKRATNGESTQSAKSISRSRDSLWRPVQSIKPSEPRAPAGIETGAKARRSLGNLFLPAASRRSGSGTGFTLMIAIFEVTLYHKVKDVKQPSHLFPCGSLDTTALLKIRPP